MRRKIQNDLKCERLHGKSIRVIYYAETDLRNRGRIRADVDMVLALLISVVFGNRRLFFNHSTPFSGRRWRNS
jgi:hypothetical protein